MKNRLGELHLLQSVKTEKFFCIFKQQGEL